MPDFQTDDTFFLYRWSNRKRTRLLLVALVVVFLTTVLFSREYAASNSSYEEDTHHIEMANVYPPTLTSTITVTSTYTSPPYIETVTNTIIPQPEPIVFSLIMWSRDSAIEGALLIKTILMYTSSPTEFHIICDEVARDFLETRLSLLTNPSHSIKVRFYQLSSQSMKDRISREGSIRSDHASGYPGLMKLFIHEILPQSVKKSIYIDTDAFFISDPTLLWNTFSKLKPTTAIVMSYHPDENSPIWNYASRICSCVMLLDLEKLRELRLMDSSVYRDVTDDSHPLALAPPTFRAKYGEPGPNGYENVKLGDQGYWWAIVDHRPDVFEPLSFDFEITSCLMDSYSIGLGDDGRTEADELPRQSHVKGTQQEGTLIRPKLLHFNCLHGTNVYMEWDGWSQPDQALTKRWGPAVSYHHGYRWIWLNQGPMLDSPAKVDISTNSNVVFADMQFARDHAAHIS